MNRRVLSLIASGTALCLALPMCAQAGSDQTTVTKANTGTTNTYDSARVGNNHYASSDGNEYKNTGDGWQKAGPSGWQSSDGDNSWADREQQARTQSDSRFGAFQRGGFANRFDGGGFHR
jgi:hypothetical protein